MKQNQLYKKIPLMPHQQRFVDQNPRKALLNWEMRVGKTLPGCYWVDHPCRNENAYIVTPKSNKKDWSDMGTSAKVYSKEEFKKIAHTIKKPTAILIDEAHYFGSGLFVKGRSQLATALYELIQENPECDVLLLTATAIRNDAWSLHTLLCYIGQYYDWKAWRTEFFALKKLPFLRFPAWIPRPTWKMDIRKYLERHADIVALRDIKDDLPPPKVEIVKIKHPKYVEPTDEVVTWVHEHRYEQTGKAEYIKSLGFKKVLIVVKYTDQINYLAKELADEKPVFILDGHTKDREETKRLAQEADECYFIVQSSMGFGFDGWMFGAMVFASASHSIVDHTQMVGRLTHAIHYNAFNYIYLIGGKWDQRIYDTLESGKNFNPHYYLHENAYATETE